VHHRDAADLAALDEAADSLHCCPAKSMWPPASAVMVGAPPVNTTLLASFTLTPAPKRNCETEKLATPDTPAMP
jgi:hypothetical protein